MGDMWGIKSRYKAAMNNEIRGDRGLFMGGEHSPDGAENAIDYITISATGNATDFGDLSLARGDNPSTGTVSYTHLTLPTIYSV